MDEATAASGLAEAGPLLFLDGSGVVARVGVWDGGRWRGYWEAPAPALEGLFLGARAALAEAQTNLGAVRGFLFVEGPGSVLGLRLAAMAIRAWQTDDTARRAPRPVWSCGSLPLAALLAQRGGAAAPFAVCTHARQNAWWMLEVPDADPCSPHVPAPRVVEGEAVVAGRPLFFVPSRRQGAPPPPARALEAALRDHPAILATPGLFRRSPSAAPLLGEGPAYRKWSGAGPG